MNPAEIRRIGDPVVPAKSPADTCSGLLLSGDQPETLKWFPDIDEDEMIRFVTLTASDVVFVDPG